MLEERLHQLYCHLFRQASTFECVVVRGPERRNYLEQVWDLYRSTYATIGMHLTGPSELLDYDQWELCEDGLGEVRQFTLFKNTPYGLKTGLSGHDGTPEAKSWAVQLLRKRFDRPNVYGEVSHKVKDIVLNAGAPAVCAVFVPKVLGKSVQEVGPLEYTRSLGSLGSVTKVLVGRPRGVPTTSSKSPSCPITDSPRLASDEDVEEDPVDRDAHLSCLLSSS